MPGSDARASALGVLPGVSAQEAAQVVAGEFPDALFLPVLPERGPGADPIGRTAGLLSAVSSDFSTTVVPSGWQISRTPGIDMQRAHDFLRQDQDAIEEHAQGFSQRFTCTVVGPISWCAKVESASGESLIRDLGAVSEVSLVLAEAVRAHIHLLQRIFPNAQLTIILEEPYAAAACTGTIPTASGLNSYVNIDRARILEFWEPIVSLAENLSTGFGISMGVDNELFVEPLLSAGATTFFDVAESGWLGDVIDQKRTTNWAIKPTLTVRENALDIAHRITSLGFTLSETAGSLIVVPQPASVSRDWVSARSAITAVREVVDLLNDEDRLLGE
jgi:hypothetical protein